MNLFISGLSWVKGCNYDKLSVSPVSRTNIQGYLFTYLFIYLLTYLFLGSSPVEEDTCFCIQRGETSFDPLIMKKWLIPAKRDVNLL